MLIDDGFNFSCLKNYPYVIKPYKGSGSSNVFIVQNEIELKSILEYLGTEENIILQQYIGDLANEYTVGILSEPVKGYVQHIILKRDLSLGLSIKQRVKNNSGNPIFGNTLGISTGISQGSFVDNPIISEAVLKLVKILKPTSTINMQCRVYQGKAYIFEVNPRFSGTSNLRALVGFNEPEYLIKSSLNLAVPQLQNRNWIGKTVLRGLSEYYLNHV
jgi:carbamoyl-phosphate synthase large subunit